MALKMTSTQVVKKSVTNNSSFQNYSHPDDHTIQTTNTPGFKPFTLVRITVFGEDIHAYNIYLPANVDSFVPVIFQNTCCDSY